MLLQFNLILLLTTVTTSARPEADAPESEARSDTAAQLSEAEAKGRQAGDVFNMAASMRAGGGAGRTEVGAAQGSSFSRSLGLEWRLELDGAANYRLSWRANLSANEILFALDINASKSQFRIGTDIFALGFSERGQLESSDFCLIWHDLSHRLHLQDARTSANNTLELLDAAGGGSACKLLNRHHRKREEPRDSPTLKVEIDYEDNEDNNEESKFAAAAESNSQREAIERPSAGKTSAGKQAADSDERLEVIFTRPLEPCEPASSEQPRHRFYRIDNGTTHLVWFSLRGPVLALDGLNLSEALNQAAGGARDWPARGLERSGMRRVQMIASKPAPAAAAAAATRQLEIRLDQYRVPARETTYLCRLFKLAARFEARRYHVVRYEAALEPAETSERVVHHMELFNCVNLNGEERAQLEQLARANWSGECNSSERPLVTRKCKRVVLAWAMGARPLVYPPEVGQSIGGPGYSPFVLLEVHYNNVQRAPNLLDSSGFRLQYSARLRAYDAGVLEVGLEYTDKSAIPPGLVVPLAGHCLGECTRAAMSGQLANRAEHYRRRHRRQHPRNRTSSSSSNSNSNQHQRQRPAIYIFAAQMHTHLSGVASWTEHVRGNQLLGELQRDDHYSPHFQEIRLLPRPVRVEPGDALLHYCLYDTRARTNITLGGFATADEMCVTYLHYYPRIELEVCKSSVDTRALSAYFERLARDESQATTALESEPESEFGSETETETETENDDDQDDELEREASEGGQSRARKSPDRAAHARAHKAVSANYRSIDWSARRSRELIEFYHAAPLAVQCERPDGSRWPGAWTGLEPARFSQVHERFLEELEEPRTFNSNGRGRELLAYRGLGARRRRRCERAPGGPAPGQRRSSKFE